MEVKSQIALSVEEMHILQLQGMDTSDASMCWIKEPNSRYRQLVIHDEYCYEMGCLDPVPTYTLEDIILKTKGEVSLNSQIAEDPTMDKPWTFRTLKYNNGQLENSIIEWGNTPLEAAFTGLFIMQKEAPEGIRHVNKE